MIGSLYLAWRYLLFHRIKSGVLVGSIALILFVPAALQVLVDRMERDLAARADATPLVVGAKGSPVELVLNSIYFGAEVPALLPHAEVTRVAATGLADPIPLYVRFHSQGVPIVGTTLAYFEFRKLRVVRGNDLGRLGDCVLGARVARERDLDPGDSVISSPESVVDLAGVYPLKMRVVGVLDWSDSPDDDAIFVDVKTTWVIHGLAHGHKDPDGHAASEPLSGHEGAAGPVDTTRTTYNEVTAENVQTFHLHGDPATYPLTAILPVPRDPKSATLLRGRYQRSGEVHQILKPRAVMAELLDTVLTARSLVLAGTLLVGLAALATTILVFALSRRMRRREIETFVKIGGTRASVAGVLWLEVLIVLVAGACLAALMTWIVSSLGADVLRALLR
ncbi:MAG: hypothetical protein GY946_14440 [bacterium]|nr:hypothetical protein [bacterium]